jgi:hypothetical protein
MRKEALSHSGTAPLFAVSKRPAAEPHRLNSRGAQTALYILVGPCGASLWQGPTSKYGHSRQRCSFGSQPRARPHSDPAAPRRRHRPRLPVPETRFRCVERAHDVGGPGSGLRSGGWRAGSGRREGPTVARGSSAGRVGDGNEGKTYSTRRPYRLRDLRSGRQGNGRSTDARRRLVVHSAPPRPRCISAERWRAGSGCSTWQ